MENYGGYMKKTDSTEIASFREGLVATWVVTAFIILLVMLVSFGIYFANYAQKANLGWTHYWQASEHPIVLFVVSLGVPFLCLLSLLMVFVLIGEDGKEGAGKIIGHLMFVLVIVLLGLGFLVKVPQVATDYNILATVQKSAFIPNGEVLKKEVSEGSVTFLGITEYRDKNDKVVGVNMDRGDTISETAKSKSEMEAIKKSWGESFTYEVTTNQKTVHEPLLKLPKYDSSVAGRESE